MSAPSPPRAPRSANPQARPGSRPTPPPGLPLPTEEPRPPLGLLVKPESAEDLEDTHELEDLEDEGLADQNCFICTEPISYYALGPCNHRICHICSLRLRALYKIYDCPYCKRVLKTVIYSKDSSRSYSSFRNAELPRNDSKLGIRFDSVDVFDDTMILLRFNCPDPDCDVACPGGWKDLKKHVKEAHGKSLCDICTRHKKVFTHEHALYTAEELRRHSSEGDAASDPTGTGFTGHPECGFCRSRFYGNDELYEHCRQRHEECFVCKRKGVMHRYYFDYQALENHFTTAHFACRHPQCVERKFVVFDSDIDLRAHEAEVHNAPGRKVKIDVGITYTSSREGPRAYSEGRSGGSAGGSASVGHTGPTASSASAGPVGLAGNRGGRQDRTPADIRASLRVPEGFGTQLTNPEPPRVQSGRGGRNSARGGRGGRRGGQGDDEDGQRAANGSSDPPLAPARAPQSAAEVAASFPSLQSAVAPPPAPVPQAIPDGLPARLLAVFDNDPTRYSQFRAASSGYKSGAITVEGFLTQVVDLALQACPADDHKRRKARLIEVGKVWNKMAETAPLEDQGRRTVPGMGNALSRRDEMVRAWNDFKIKRDREEDDRRRAEGASAFANWAGPPSMSPGGARVLVIKSTAKRHKLPPASRPGGAGAAVLERISRERREDDGERTGEATWVGGEPDAKVKLVSRDEAEATRLALSADGTSGSSTAQGSASWRAGTAVSKTPQDFPGLPKKAGAGSRAKVTSSSSGTGGGPMWAPEARTGGDASDDSDSTAWKKKGKKKQVLMYVGGQR